LLVIAKTVLLVIMILIILVWIERHIHISIVNRRGPSIKKTDAGPPIDEAPLVSVIIPACNEEHNIIECLKSVFAQDYPRFEVLVVDDRSTDNTASVVESFIKAKSAERGISASCINVKELPTDWTGKTNALRVGSEKARGDWLLFIDADTRHDPSNISRAMEFIRKENVDMLSLLPALEARSFWEKTMQPMMGGVLMLRYPFELINNPKSRIAFANGQYILIKRSVYETVGGHACVKDKFLEDVALAHTVKNFHRNNQSDNSAPFNLKVALGSSITRTRMYASFKDIFSGWSRIFYAGFDRSAAKVLLFLAAMFTFSVLPFFIFGATLVLEVAGVRGISFIHFMLALSTAQVVLLLTALVRFYEYVDCDKRFLIFYPLAGIVGVGILLNTLSKILFGSDIHWRGTNYSPNAKK